MVQSEGSFGKAPSSVDADRLKPARGSSSLSHLSIQFNGASGSECRARLGQRDQRESLQVNAVGWSSPSCVRALQCGCRSAEACRSCSCRPQTVQPTQMSEALGVADWLSANPGLFTLCVDASGQARRIPQYSLLAGWAQYEPYALRAQPPHLFGSHVRAIQGSSMSGLQPGCLGPYSSPRTHQTRSAPLWPCLQLRLRLLLQQAIQALSLCIAYPETIS